jgi:transcription factor SPN1
MSDDSRPVTPLPEAGHDSGDPNRPLSEERDTPPAPIANPNLDMDDLDNQAGEDDDDARSVASEVSDLSELEDGLFDNFDASAIAVDKPEIAIDDTNVGTLKASKRRKPEGEDGEPKTKKKKEGRREPKKRREKVRDEDVDPDHLEMGPREKKSERRERAKRPTSPDRSQRKEREPEKEENLSPEESRSLATIRIMWNNADIVLLQELDVNLMRRWTRH